MSTLTLSVQIDSRAREAARNLLHAGTHIQGARPDRQTVLREVYRAHAEQIYRFVFFKVHNREDAEDITSQVFFKAAQSLDIDQEEHIRLAWLYQVARTTVADHWRGFYRNPAASLEQIEEVTGDTLALQAPPLRPGAIEEEEATGEINRLRALMSMLPDNYRRVLQLRFLQGCSIKETALAMGISEGNAKVLQHRALRRAEQVSAAA